LPSSAQPNQTGCRAARNRTRLAAEQRATEPDWLPSSAQPNRTGCRAARNRTRLAAEQRATEPDWLPSSAQPNQTGYRAARNRTVPFDFGLSKTFFFSFLILLFFVFLQSP
ncbi:MAG: hypothetical protein KBT04_02550, partial [Bacteroidales bacterium]|nr:hypothetical protein [Candidatus Colimorpha onthohippi]